MTPELLLLAVLGVVVIAGAAAVGRRLNIAAPLLLVLIGLAVSVLPFVDIPEVDPEIILVGILPPLLYSAAVSLPALEFRRDFSHIAGLSVLLVVVSAVVLGFFFAAVIPGLGLPLAFALGAILSPTDAVATSIVRRLGLSRRVVTMLEGESLLNDATSLVILRTAVGAFLAGTATFGGAIWAFVWGSAIAVVVGAIVGVINLRLRAFVRNSAAATAVGLVVPFAAYAPTEMLGGSGLVAAVVAGIVMGQGSARWSTPEQRLSDTLNWRTIELVLEGSVFLIMGLELSEIVAATAASDHGLGTAAWLAAAAFGIVVAVRAVYVTVLVWVQSRRARERRREHLQALADRLDGLVDSTGSVRIPLPRGHRLRARPPATWRRRVRGRIRSAIADVDYFQASPLGWRHGTVIVWAGMRGVVTLAAAQTLPRDTPERPVLILVAFLVAVGSLMLQGFTLPALVRALGLHGSGRTAVTRQEREIIDAQLFEAAAGALVSDDLTRRDGTPFPSALIETVSIEYLDPPDDDDQSPSARDRLELRLQLIEAMRRRLAEMSLGGQFSTPALRRALAELDADELSIQLRLTEGD